MKDKFNGEEQPQNLRRQWREVGKTTPLSGPIRSDGGSSSYYTFFLPSAGWIETEEVIQSMVDNDFDLGNIVKASRRIAAERQGIGKKGTTEMYDWKKIKYTAEKMIKILEDA